MRDPNEVAAYSAVLKERFFVYFDLADVEILHTFLPIERYHEIQTWLILDRIWTDHGKITTVAPRIDFKTGELEHLRFTSATELIENRWGVLEPSVRDRVKPEKIDFVIVPLIAYDRRGYRVGYGKGYYDKFLAKCRPDCVKVGLSLFPPVDEITDINENDVKLDYCLTPDEMFEF